MNEKQLKGPRRVTRKGSATGTPSAEAPTTTAFRKTFPPLPTEFTPLPEASFKEIQEFIGLCRENGALKVHLSMGEFSLVVEFPQAVKVQMDSTKPAPAWGGQMPTINIAPTHPATGPTVGVVPPSPITGGDFAKQQSSFYQNFLTNVVQPNAAGMSDAEKAEYVAKAKAAQNEQEERERREYERVMYYSADKGTI